MLLLRVHGSADISDSHHAKADMEAGLDSSSAGDLNAQVSFTYIQIMPCTSLPIQAACLQSQGNDGS